MKCPVCKDVTLLMSERQGIEIDYCPECRGVWLDRGELDKILEKEKNYTDKHYTHDNDINHHKQDEHSQYKNSKKRRKESFIEDIFDIF